MTDLEINIALAKAMGWKLANKESPNEDSEYGVSITGNVYAVLCWDAKAQEIRTFDYRDPVIFVAICKRWKLAVNNKAVMCWCPNIVKDISAETIEKAAALCVIDAVKRGVK